MKKYVILFLLGLLAFLAIIWSPSQSNSRVMAIDIPSHGDVTLPSVQGQDPLEELRQKYEAENIPYWSYDPCTSTLKAAEAHRRLLNEDYPEEVLKSLKDENVQLHRLEADRDIYYDDFRITVELPEGSISADEIFERMLRGMDVFGEEDIDNNTDIVDAGGRFRYWDPKAISSRPDERPKVGDIFQVKIGVWIEDFPHIIGWMKEQLGIDAEPPKFEETRIGIDNGDVMLTDLHTSSTHSYWRFSTIYNPNPDGAGNHPLLGSREYGFEAELDRPNTYTFYTRGVDQWNKKNDLWAVEIWAGMAQRAFWFDVMENVGKLATVKGGNVLSGPTYQYEPFNNYFGLDLPVCHQPQKRQVEDDITPREGNSKVARNYGDPHLFTFDNYRYSFQSIGEFLLAKTDDSVFEVQVRQAPINNFLSIDNAVALGIGIDWVSLYASEFPNDNSAQPLWINGHPVVDLSQEKIELRGGGKVYLEDSTYTFEWPTGEKLVAQINGGDIPFINLTVYVFESQKEHLVGLFGNANGDPSDDLKFRDGQQLPNEDSYGVVENLLNRATGGALPLSSAKRLYLQQLNKDFGSSWLLKQSESLFTYGLGRDTRSFSLDAFPSKYVSLEQLSSTQISEARSECLDRNVSPELMEGCIFDVAFSGMGEFAVAAARVSEVTSILRTLGIGVPDPLDSVEDVIDEVIDGDPINIFRRFPRF